MPVRQANVEADFTAFSVLHDTGAKLRSPYFLTKRVSHYVSVALRLKSIRAHLPLMHKGWPPLLKVCHKVSSAQVRRSSADDAAPLFGLTTSDSFLLDVH